MEAVSTLLLGIVLLWFPVSITVILIQRERIRHLDWMYNFESKESQKWYLKALDYQEMWSDALIKLDKERLK